MNTHEIFIKECIELAKFGEGRVSPNPLVGSVVLDKNNNAVGRGCHMKYGEAHAEINALNEAGDKAKGGTIYINLEPCSHFGKTPPCAERVIKSGVKKVVVGMVDPNPQVAGEGIKKIQAAGIKVVSGVLESQCKKLNEIFIKHITKQEPFIAVKTASTLDGKIATRTGSSKWITSDAAREEVQRLRNKYDAILTGSGTIIKDNPSLTCRLKEGRNPVRVIIDSELKTDPNFKVYNNDSTRIFIAASEKAEGYYPENVEIIRCPLTVDGKIDLNYFIKELYKRGIVSILVEAGGKLNGAFLKNNLVDKFYCFIAPKILGDSSAYSTIDGFDIENISQCTDLKFDEVKFFSPDIMIEAYL